MDEHPDPITRLGPDSGGRGPGSARDGIRGQAYVWEWGPGPSRRPGLPWIGIFLLVFGGLLLVQQLFPEARAIGSVTALAIGLAFLVKWAISRGTGSLYAGAIITALAVPGALAEADLDREGIGTLSFGVAFLFIAAVRAASGGGVGWQAWFGGLLTLLGAVSLLTPGVGGLILPLTILGLGLVLLIGGARGRSAG
jgi:hypothetical protein